MSRQNGGHLDDLEFAYDAEWSAPSLPLPATPTPISPRPSDPRRARPGLPAFPVTVEIAAPSRPTPRPLAPVRARRAAVEQAVDLGTRLRRMVEFTQWQRVAMARYGLVDVDFASLPGDPLLGLCSSLPAARTARDLVTLRRAYERAHAIATGNRRAVDQALRDLARALGIEADAPSDP